MDNNDRSAKPVILVKYGGNAMSDEMLKKQVLENICALKKTDHQVVIVHGGGPFIKQALEMAKIESEFIDGHRKTSAEAFEHVEMALKGKVNGNLVSIINSLGYRAVGLSGKDGNLVIATKRLHRRSSNGKTETVDLGQVGDVAEIDISLIDVLLNKDFIPVITCLADDRNGNGFNINADMFAGHLAGALNVDQYVVLTDVDGLYHDKDDPYSLMKELELDEINELLEQGVIRGGMIPKIESCRIALNTGAGLARIINGTKPEQLLSITAGETVGTLIHQSQNHKKS